MSMILLGNRVILPNESSTFMLSLITVNPKTTDFHNEYNGTD
jgi:hypothetical protein